ncbi:COX15/CtaA family protein [Polynucleobacter acidiphobus]|uniref:COX15/CtaA family protein n=1 Tax=Polynucleobacter acidiphobus TaxID=556053 RepID=UPI001F2A02E3|nr:COX15/CtaA family protein [Polynucleobacter acidiphobus]
MMSEMALMVLELAGIALLIAGLPLAFLYFKKGMGLFQKLNWTIVFLTFDLILFGAFTRLSDSGLGCPDWPGCYGTSNPFRAIEEIRAAEAAMPTGPVTVFKAWVEMIHRYLAMSVGFLIIIQVIMAFKQPSAGRSLAIRGSLFLLVLVCLQGAFGAWTVTLKLQPIIVSMHLILALILFASMVWFAQRNDARYSSDSRTISSLSGGLVLIAIVALFAQIFLGAWVSTNYAVLACPDFPTCMGVWYPNMDWQNAFFLWRDLGEAKSGEMIPMAALVTIHWTHRVGAIFASAVLLFVAIKVIRYPEPKVQFWGKAIIALLALQIATGISNVVFQWPLVAALLHTSGAAAILFCLVRLSAWSNNYFLSGKPLQRGSA